MLDELMFNPRFHDTDRLVAGVTNSGIYYRLNELAQTLQQRIQTSPKLHAYALSFMESHASAATIRRSIDRCRNAAIVNGRRQSARHELLDPRRQNPRMAGTPGSCVAGRSASGFSGLHDASAVFKPDVCLQERTAVARIDQGDFEPGGCALSDYKIELRSRKWRLWRQDFTQLLSFPRAACECNAGRAMCPDTKTSVVTAVQRP